MTAHRHPLERDGTCRACARIAERAAAYSHADPQLGRSVPDTDDVRAVIGDRGARAGRAYAWCAREDAYHVATEGATVAIPRKTTNGARIRAVSFPSSSLGYCEACGVTRADHVRDDGHAYRAAMATYAVPAVVRARALRTDGARGRGAAVLRTVARARVERFATAYESARA